MLPGDKWLRAVTLVTEQRNRGNDYSTLFSVIVAVVAAVVAAAVVVVIAAAVDLVLTSRRLY